MLFLNANSFAAEDNPTEPDEVEDPQLPMPIDDYIIPMLLAGSFLGYILIKRNAKEA